MIFGNQSISTYTRANISIWMILAFQAGMLNTGGFMACHTFVSHVTGYATLFGVEAGQFNWEEALALMMVPGFFLVGAMGSGILVDLRLRLGKKPKYYLVFGVMFALILGVEIGGFNGLFGRFGEPLEHGRDYALLALLCLVCGMQNGTVTLVSRSVVRTTHLTGVTTDLGIGLIRVFNRRRLAIGDEMRANGMRIGIIIFFVLGSVFAFWAFRRWGFRGFIFPTITSGLLFLTTFYFQVIRRER